MPTDNENATDSPELRILQLMKKVLTDVAKDTYTPPALRHPLTENTINGIRECLVLISAREQELAGSSRHKPRFVDEPQDSVVVQLERENPAGKTEK